MSKEKTILSYEETVDQRIHCGGARPEEHLSPEDLEWVKKRYEKRAYIFEDAKFDTNWFHTDQRPGESKNRNVSVLGNIGFNRLHSLVEGDELAKFNEQQREYNRGGTYTDKGPHVRADLYDPKIIHNPNGDKFDFYNELIMTFRFFQRKATAQHPENANRQWIAWQPGTKYVPLAYKLNAETGLMDEVILEHDLKQGTNVVLNIDLWVNRRNSGSNPGMGFASVLVNEPGEIPYFTAGNRNGNAADLAAAMGLTLGASLPKTETKPSAPQTTSTQETEPKEVEKPSEPAQEVASNDAPAADPNPWTEDPTPAPASTGNPGIDSLIDFSSLTPEQIATITAMAGGAKNDQAGGINPGQFNQ